MAIVIKNYQWRQTDTKIIIYVPIKGRPRNVDLFVMDNYVKISFPPFILELFLWENVLEEESKCTLTDTEAVFSLQKAGKAINWPSLEIENISKSEKCCIRNRILDKAQNLLENRAKQKNERRQYLQKEAVKIQINLDTNMQNKIEALRTCHRQAAMQDFEEWRSRAEIPILQDISGKVQKNRKMYRPPLKWFEDDLNIIQSQENNKHEKKDESVIIEELKEELDVGKKSEDSESDNEIASCKSSSNSLIIEMDEDSSQKFKTEEEKQIPGKDLVNRILKGQYPKINRIFDEPKKAIPLPRKSGSISVTFSERAFPTPARESAFAKEQEWLSKQAEARRKTGFVVENLRPEELDPQWLKDKGDDFFKAGNYLAAISAYTHGIKISDKMTALYVNRSAAHYALGNYYKCIDDCSKVTKIIINVAYFLNTF
ncbi:hypothetical protein PUN28_007794 [Cardiocondyla obscurior]|uniref:CS domain-containing protein n=1 Tax=Cardiocondyla obscurior TaxID=286306 RepID=A0AAW2FUX6_9HYME